MTGRLASAATRLLGGGHPRGRLPARRSDTLAAEARQVGVRHGDRQILDRVDLQIRYGEVLALVGPNGAGKSTLLGALAGDVQLSRGEVDVDGEPLSRWSAAELAWRRAVLPQQAALAFPFLVSEVVAMGRAPWAGRPEAADDDRLIASAMARAGCAEFADRRVPSLSGGELARVALARALAQQAPLLLLDEPTAALDLRHQELVLQLAVEQAARGDAVVVVLHDLHLASGYADRIALLADGRLRAIGPPSEVLGEQLLAEVYQHPVEVVAHPRTGEPLVLPRRPVR
jgi:iron complex transport system ATP-binding protein